MPRKSISAKEFKESVHLTLGVVKPARAGPAVRAAVDRLVAVGFDDAPQLAGQQFGELVPRDGDELVGAPARARAWPVTQPAAPDRRRGHAGAMAQRAWQVAQQR